MDDRTLIQNIAKNLRQLRKQRNLTQEQLIEKIGSENISLRSYKSYENENSTRVPLLEKLSLIADFYKCSLDYIVFNKSSIYDESFTKRDSLRRIADLIYSFVLIPQKDNNSKSDYFGKYYFLAYDEDVSLLMDKITSISREINNKYEYEGVAEFELLKTYNDCINSIKNLDEDWSPSLNRLKLVMLESKNDFNKYLEERTETIKRKRKINSLK